MAIKLSETAKSNRTLVLIVTERAQGLTNTRTAQTETVKSVSKFLPVEERGSQGRAATEEKRPVGEAAALIFANNPKFWNGPAIKIAILVAHYGPCLYIFNSIFFANLYRSTSWSVWFRNVLVHGMQLVVISLASNVVHKLLQIHITKKERKFWVYQRFHREWILPLHRIP